MNGQRQRLDLGSREAAAIAREVLKLSPDGRAFDEDWIQLNRDWVQHVIQTRIMYSPYVHHVEILER